MRRFNWPSELVKAGLFGAVGAVLTLSFSPNNLDHSGSRIQPVHAATQVVNPHPLPSSPLESKPVELVGLPSSSHLRVFDGFLCSYDRRGRIPQWVLEHLTPSKLGHYTSNGPQNNESTVNRKQFDFYEDLGEISLFRSSNADYHGSGYDRGHMAAAGNHRFEKSAMQQTFILSNIAPQVGVGFNRHAWNDLEKYVRSIARRTANVIVITGPLFLPRSEGSKKFVRYEVIGPNNVAVPTHFYKAAAIQERADGPWHVSGWVLPNAQLPEKVDFKQFQVPLTTIEHAAGLKLFPNLPPSP